MKTELEKQLHEAELEKLNAIDKVKQLKERIAELSKEPSIFELMPIGSVWCGWEVFKHDEATPVAPIGLFGLGWPPIANLHNLIAEQQKLDAMKKAADAAVEYSGPIIFPIWLRQACDDYRKILDLESRTIS